MEAKEEVVTATTMDSAGESKYAKIDEMFHVSEEKAPNKTMRIKLARQWEKLSSAEQTTLRSNRARRGVKCHVCGMLGVYKENCPNRCSSPTTLKEDDDDKDEEERVHKRMQAHKNFELCGDEQAVGLGIMWGNVGAGETKEEKNIRRRRERRKAYRKKMKHGGRKAADAESMEEESESSDEDHGFRETLFDLRPRALAEADKLKKSDSTAQSFNFFTVAEDGYHRNMSELTLHQVMRRLMRLLQDQLIKNATSLENKRDSTLLHPPVHKAGKTFYPPELANVPEYRDFYFQKLAKEDKTRLNYQYKGGERPIDAMDALFRGKINDDLVLYRGNKKAGACMHSRIGWKDPLATNDALASSDPAMLKRAEDVDKLFAQQGAWVVAQKDSMKQLNDRFEHLIFVLKEEMLREHEREYRILGAGVTGGIQGKKTEGPSVISMDVREVAEQEEVTGEIKPGKKSAVKVGADGLLIPTGTGVGMAGVRTQTDEVIESNTKKTKSEEIKLWVERMESVDRIMLTLQAYDIVSGLDEVDFLLFMLRRWKSECMRKLDKFHRDGARLTTKQRIEKHEALSQRGSPKGGKGANFNSMADGDMESVDSASEVSSTMVKPKKAKQKKNASASSVGTMNPYEAQFMHILPPKKHVKAGPPSSTLSKAAQIAEPVQKPSRGLAANLVMKAISAAAIREGDPDKIDPFLEQRNEDTSGKIASDVVVAAAAADSDAADAKGDGIATVPHAATSSPPRAIVKKQSTVVEGKPKLGPREKDALAMKKAKVTFTHAGMKRFIRTGENTDVAYTCPALIPIPATFAKDGLDVVKSHVASDIIFDMKKSMVLGNLGYTPQRLVPLYVRNTLVESNGCTAGGDQTQEIMSKDSRYTHTFGRPFNRFEPPEELEKERRRKAEKKAAYLRMANNGVETEKQRIHREEKEKKRLAKIEAVELKKLQEEVKGTGMNRSLVRLVFGNGHSKQNTYYD